MPAFETIATLFAYPQDDYVDRALSCARELDSDDLRAFAALMAAMPVAAQQELFVQSFDLNPASTLEIGWHLYGEQYERGDFLVELRQQLRTAGIAETGELPDHLLHVLPMLARMPAEAAMRFAESRLLPALDKIAAALPDGSPFHRLIRATCALAPVSTAAGG
jgi:nitrate reductase delta subunit